MKKTLADVQMSVLDLSPIRAGETAANALRDSLALAQHAEKLGFNRFWLAEHHNMPGIASAATAVVIGQVAAGTNKIRVGAGGIMLSNHAPLVIAEQFGTLESLFPNRIDLGLGRAPGSDGLTARALRRKLSGDDDFPDQLEELQFFLRAPIENQRVRAVPGAGLNLPIWLLGSSDFSARLAGETGLPFAFAGHFSPEYIVPALELYKNSFKPSGTLDKPYSMLAINIIAAETQSEAEFLATSQFQMHLGLVRGAPGQLQPPVENMNRIWNEAEKTWVESRLGGSIIGDREAVKNGLERFLTATNVDEFIVNTMIYDFAARLRSYEIAADVWQNSKVFAQTN